MSELLYLLYIVGKVQGSPFCQSLELTCIPNDFQEQSTALFYQNFTLNQSGAHLNAEVQWVPLLHACPSMSLNVIFPQRSRLPKKYSCVGFVYCIAIIASVKGYVCHWWVFKSILTSLICVDVMESFMCPVCCPMSLQ